MKKQKLLILLAVLVLQSLAVAIDVPEVLPDPDALTPNNKIPVKVFILAGQSNMVGFGRIAGTGPGTLETITAAGMFPWLVDDAGDWTVRNDVMYRGVISATGNGPLTPKFGANGSHFGPELGFGHVMGYCYDEPVIVLKSSQGNRSISWDYAPPSTPRFDYNGNTYAGYGDSPNSWVTGTGPSPYVWYAGKQWDDCFMDEADMGASAWTDATDYPANCQVSSSGITYISKSEHTSSGASEPGIGGQSSTYWNIYAIFNVTDILDNFASEYPEYAFQGFQIAGYAWWQGNKDRNEPHVSRYELNMVNFINDIRDYFESRYPVNTAPNTPFVIATFAEGGWEMTGGSLTVAEAQLAAGDPAIHPEFAGNVKTVEARGYWRDGDVSPSTAGYHYNHNAETYMLVGDAMGRAMAEMLVADNSTTPKIIYPGYGDVVAAYPVAVTLEWENMDPNAESEATATYVDVWFGTDPNKLSDDYTRIVTEQSTSSHTFTPPGPGKFYWQVDSYLHGNPGIIDYTDGDPCMLPGRIYMFTNDGRVESVDILTNGTTTDTITWSGEPVPLDTAVVDDGGSPLSYLWTANPADGVVFSDATDPASTVTLTATPGHIPIANAGFEEPALADDVWGWGHTGWGWFATDSIGNWNIGAGVFGGIAPEGEHIGFADGKSAGEGGFAQILTETLTADTTYTLTVEVGNDGYYAWTGYKVQLLAGGTGTAPDEITGGYILAEDDNSMAIAVEEFKTSTVIYTYDEVADANKVGLPLQIRLIAKSGSEEVDFDNVKLVMDRPSPHPTAVTLTLAVNDETNPAKTDTMTFDVYENACIAARYGFDLSISLESDYNENCLTGPEDLETMIAAWLDDSSATEAYIGFTLVPTWNGTTITGTTGNKNAWNQDGNWDNGVPSGTVDAIVADGVYATVDSPDTPAYDGSLILGVGSTLQLGWTTKANSQNRNALGNDQIVMNDGSVIISRAGFENYTFNQKIVLEGDGTIWAGISTAAHHSTKTFSGEISGPGMLIYNGVNNTWFKMNHANPNWSGGFMSNDPQNQAHQVRADVDGCFGTGDVTINKNCSLQIGSGDTIDDMATLFVNEAMSTRVAAKLILNSNETVAAFYLDGVKQDDGTYDSTSTLTSSDGNPLITGNGSLIVASPDPTLPSVDAGGNIFTASGITMTMAPTVVNNDTEPQGSLTYAWTAEPADGVEITNADQENAIVTITKAAPTGGIEIVTMTLSVTLAGKDPVTDKVEVAVYDDGCELIKDVDPSKIAQTDHVGNDCLTNIADFAVLAADWLEDYSLAAPVDKPVE